MLTPDGPWTRSAQNCFMAFITVDVKHYPAGRGAAWDREVSLLPCRCEWAGRGSKACGALSLPYSPAMHAPLRPCNTLTEVQPP